MQNLHGLSLQCLIHGRTPFLCRDRRPCSLMCPRCLCHSLVVSSFSVITEPSPITTFLITLYKFTAHSALRTVMELVVTFKAPSIPVNLYPWASKAPNERNFFLRSGMWLTSLSVRTYSLKIFMRILSIPSVLHVTSLPIRTVLFSKGSCADPLLSWGTCGMCIPGQPTKYPRTTLFVWVHWYNITWFFNCFIGYASLIRLFPTGTSSISS